jgi:hypothetical protein
MNWEGPTLRNNIRNVCYDNIDKLRVWRLPTPVPPAILSSSGAVASSGKENVLELLEYTVF